jgi:hypothetical protein
MRNISFWTFATSLAFGAMVALSETHAANLLLNGDFEDGVYTSTIGGNTNTEVPVDWTPNAAFNLEPGFNHVTSAFAESGTSSLSIGNFDDQPLSELSQTFADVSGATYNVSFWAFDDGSGGDPAAFLTVSAGGSSRTLDDTVAFPFQNFTFSFVGSGSDTLTIAGQTNPAEWIVDNVSVTGAVIPEASTWAMMLLGFVGLGYAGYQASRRTALIP